MKKNPNDELRFLMENPTRSDFFIGMANVGFQCVVTSSCCTEINSGVTSDPYSLLYSICSSLN
ncbi:hypothetical protein COA23_06590 [Priestia megaterium]|nr:hypothetical protein CN397_11755 [Priestia megaterium]PFQ78410.1 hypothetical protein COK11_22560 [Priestia megaterium]PFW50343.1 hypothetical protein COL17_10075 [Priestia megaterium]PGR09362.1 hypothetical protein COA23_06590 [Priestia megaterium]